MHPVCYRLAHALRAGEAESAVTVVTAFADQLLDGKGLLGAGDLLVAADEIVDAQIVDIGVVGDALTGEILAEIRAVGANRPGQLLKAQVVLQVKLCGRAVLCQQLFDLGEVDIGEIGRCYLYLGRDHFSLRLWSRCDRCFFCFFFR